MESSDGLPEATIDGAPIGYDHVEKLIAAASLNHLRATKNLIIDDDLTLVMLEHTA